MPLRTLPPDRIPPELWADQTLRLPQVLTSEYEKRLHAEGVYEKAKAGTQQKDVVGGITKEETLDHFAYRFCVSAGRVEFATISPSDQLVDVSEALLSTFSDGRISLLDLPFGTGTATASLLCTLATLRAQRVLPVVPLNIHVLGADISSTARDVGDALLIGLQPYLASTGIALTHVASAWDATDVEDTAKVMDSWLAASPDAEEYVVCISNFSGALIKAGLLDAFQPSLTHILARLHDKKYTLLWIEPPWEPALKLWDKVVAFFARVFPRLTPHSGDPINSRSDYKLLHPIMASELHTGVAVKHFARK